MIGYKFTPSFDHRPEHHIFWQLFQLLNVFGLGKFITILKNLFNPVPVQHILHVFRAVCKLCFATFPETTFRNPIFWNLKEKSSKVHNHVNKPAQLWMVLVFGVPGYTYKHSPAFILKLSPNMPLELRSPLFSCKNTKGYEFWRIFAPFHQHLGNLGRFISIGLYLSPDPGYHQYNKAKVSGWINHLFDYFNSFFGIVWS